MATDQPSIDIPEAHAPGAAAARLAAALGWDGFPELSPEQEREANERLAAAQAEARRIYGIDQEAA
jgi:DNA-binding MurR/RpiR family transcriptional regulator